MQRKVNEGTGKTGGSFKVFRPAEELRGDSGGDSQRCEKQQQEIMKYFSVMTESIKKKLGGGEKREE